MSIDSIAAQTLFNAVAERIQETMEASHSTGASELECFTQYDKTSGRNEVKLRYWGRQSEEVRLELAGARKMTVLYSRGDNVVCGRDNALTYHEIFILRLPVSYTHLTLPTKA